MAMLGKDLFDIHRPYTHTLVLFGERQYWIENAEEGITYGEVLTELLDTDTSAYKENLTRLREAGNEGGDIEALFKSARTELEKLPFFRSFLPREKLHEVPMEYYFRAAADLDLIQERYAWFLDEVYSGTLSEKRKGEKKLTPAEQITLRTSEAFVTGVSLGKSSERDAPTVQLQYMMRDAWDHSQPTELVERVFFDRLIDFIYVELMKGIQKGYIPKRCHNCGHWFLQEPGLTYAYCERIAPGETEKTCRDIGSRQNYQTKLRENPIWNTHSRIYKRYFARIKAGTMTKTEFEIWSRKALAEREEYMRRYNREHQPERKEMVVNEFEERLEQA